MATEEEEFIACLKRRALAEYGGRYPGVRLSAIRVTILNEGSNVHIVVPADGREFFGAARLSSGISTVRSEVRALEARGAVDYVWMLMRFVERATT